MLRSVGAFLVCFICVIGLGSLYLLRNQGMNNVNWEKLGKAAVIFDDNGIPTIRADNWNRLVWLQGYVHASERMWQMELIRRVAGGRLSELFGEKAVAFDTAQVKQDWQGVAFRAYQRMEPEEKTFCDSYADGVNTFIAQNRYALGIEFFAIMVRPEPWTCMDSLLVLLKMSDDLSKSAEEEWKQSKWRAQLSQEWQDFLFPKQHPWAKPMFGRANPFLAAPVPPVWQYITTGAPAVDDSKLKVVDPPPKGSNAWVIRNGSKAFLASDPHIDQNVPQTWYANRLYIDAKNWVVGASLVGIPGVVIGMNQSLAWSFTTIGEDVDDYLIETLSSDLSRYQLDRNETLGEEEWRPVIRKRFPLKIKGRKTEWVEGLFTHRGPIIEKTYQGTKQYFSRQWIGFRDEFLAIPTHKINTARNWSEFNKALDRMKIPRQLAIYADRDRNIGVRATGLGILRREDTGLVPQNAADGEWRGFANVSERPRKILAVARGSNQMEYIVNANAQIWGDSYGHRWRPDDRRDRIDRVLSTLQNLDKKVMEDLQLDTVSRFFKILVAWVAAHYGKASDSDQQMFVRWEKWDGSSINGEVEFCQADAMEKKLTTLVVAQVKDHFIPDKELPDYESFMRRSWTLKLLTDARGFQALGLDPKQVVIALLEDLKTYDCSPGTYSKANAWQAQHPFVNALPYVGKFFAVHNIPQFGHTHTVRAEQPNYGPSMRLVWDLTNPQNSSWIFPVGQSGHIGSRFYRDQQDFWQTGNHRLKPFSDGVDWGLQK